MKKILFILLLLSTKDVRAQDVREIFVHLYTDSLKKGTYNYINIDGQLANGTYTPLDSTEISFSASDGKFFGNSLLIDKDFSKEKVEIKVTLKKKPSLSKTFTVFIKKKADEEKLKTTEEIMNENRAPARRGRRNI